MDIDDLRSKWNSISFPPGYGGVPETSELMSRVRAGRVSTLRDRLASGRRSDHALSDGHLSHDSIFCRNPYACHSVDMLFYFHGLDALPQLPQSAAAQFLPDVDP